MTQVTIKPHQIWSPPWGVLDCPASGKTGTLISTTGPFAVVKLEDGAHFHTLIEHLILEPAPCESSSRV